MSSQAMIHPSPRSNSSAATENALAAWAARAGRLTRQPDAGYPRFAFYGRVSTEDALARALAGTHGLGAAATISRLSQILAWHTRDWASDDTALLALRVPPRS